METILTALAGALFGFAIPYVAKTWERLTRAKGMKSAVIRELLDANEEIKEKLRWLGRNVSGHLKEVDEERIVEYKERDLYLGEREEFIVSCKYWNDKFSEIVEILSEDDFTNLSQMHRLVLKFAEKFKQMKIAFETEYGDKKFMAVVCYEDLIEISKKLEERLTKQLSRHS